MAMRNDDMAVLRQLVDGGADVNSLDDDGYGLLEAIYQGKLEYVTNLFRGSNLT